MKKLSLAMTAFILTACVSTELSTSQTQYNPENHARIRLFGQNGRATTMTVTANGKEETVNVGGGAGQAFASLIGTKENESIGMPMTEFSQNPGQFSNIGSKPFYKEFIVPADAEIAVTSRINAPKNISEDPQTGITVIIIPPSCSGNKISFTAKAGKDYEVLPNASTRGCNVSLHELN